MFICCISTVIDMNSDTADIYLFFQEYRKYYLEHYY